jgi:phosphonate transport system substrate-binding protein
MYRGNRQLLLVLLLSLWAGLPMAAERLILGVQPSLERSELLRRFAPLAHYLGARVGRLIEVRVAQDYEQHIEDVGSDRLDIAFLGPAPYVLMRDRYGAKPLLARLEVDGRPELQGHIVVRNDSQLYTLEDLRDHGFAFGDPRSTMSSLVPRYMLLKAGIRERDFGFVLRLPGHQDVALAVLSGDVDAGAVRQDVLEAFRHQGLRSVAQSLPISEHLFVTRADLDPLLVGQLRQALLEMGQVPDAQPALLALQQRVTGMAPVQDADYTSMREVLRWLDGGSL